MRYLGFVLLVTMMTMLEVKAQEIIQLWPDSVPGANVHDVMEERSVSEWGGAKILTGVSEPELWLFRGNKNEAAPAVIICPGGGYRVEAYEHEGSLVAQWLNTMGINALVLKYRLPDERICANPETAPLMDLQRALQLVNKRAEEWQIAEGKVGVMGFSAGGHLAACGANLFHQPVLEGASANDVRPDFSILIYPVISMTDGLTHQGSREALLGTDPEDQLSRLYSMEQQVSATTPPTFILHAADDPAVPVANTSAYVNELNRKGVPVKKVILPEGGHGFGYKPASPTFIWLDYLKNWLEENVLD